MPLTRRQKAKAKKSRAMDMMSNFDNLDIMVGNENIDPIERELANVIENQQFNMTLSPISVQWINFTMKMNLEILIMKTILNFYE